MDHKQQLSQLDPKLREAYERVMGVETTRTPHPPAIPTAESHAPTPPTSSDEPTKKPFIVAPTITDTHPSGTQPLSTPSATLPQTPLSPAPSSQTASRVFTQAVPPAHAPTEPLRRSMASPMTETVTIGGTSGYQLHPSKTAGMKSAIKVKKKVPPAMIISGIVLFFIIYAIVWIKIFNISFFGL